MKRSSWKSARRDQRNVRSCLWHVGRAIVAALSAPLAASVAMPAFAEGASAGAYTCVASAANPPAPGLMLATRQYDWTYYEPVLSTRREPFVVRTLIPKTRSQRWDYEVPTLHTERRVLWKYPELTCRYPFGVLPNDCETVWRNAYADMPVLATEHDHLDVDVPAWKWEDKTWYVDVPQWSYVERHLVIGVPAIVAPESCAVFVGDAARGLSLPDDARAVDSATGSAKAAAMPASIEHARAGLEAELEALVAALDQSIANVDATIASVKAAGGDPAKLPSDNGKTVDLYALRASMMDQRTEAREKFSRMMNELDTLNRPAAAPR
jgi:hypothetical protein